jgi:hypothetical protein
MDKREAHQIADVELRLYREMPYERILAKVGTQECFERVSEKDEPYRIEFDFFFDDADEANIRVSAMISYSFWTDFSPVGSDFIIGPDGKFIGE